MNNNNEPLTVEILDNMKPHSMFATGVVVDLPEGINMTNSGQMLRWVAVRGHVHDWAIYTGPSGLSADSIRGWGDKVTGRDNIEKLVPCTKEAFNLYRV